MVRKRKNQRWDQFNESFQSVERNIQARPASIIVAGTLPGNVLISVILPRCQIVS